MMKIDGRCHCGKITYVGEVEPSSLSICHCTDCQVLCGSPWRASIQTTADTFRFTSSALPKIYVKTAESGRRRAQAFCGDCGTPIYAANDEAEPKVFNLRLGSIVQRDQLRPARQIWDRSAMSWAKNITTVDATEKDAG
jgi:hypothetical protein